MFTRANYMSVLLHLLLISSSCIIGWIIVPWLINWQVSYRIVLSPDYLPQIYNRWLSPPFPIHFKVYLFNVTNPDEVGKGELPILTQVGPYVFNETRTKVDVVTDVGEDTITYKELRIYHFNEELSSPLSLQDNVTFINVPFVAAAMKISNDLPWPMNDIGRTILIQNMEPLFVRKTVSEIIFSGWKVPFLEKLDQELGLNLLPNNTFSLLMKENDTHKGPYTVSRGEKDRSKFGQVLLYKNKTELEFWEKGSSCNSIRGTDGTMFPPFINISQPIRFFHPDICRSAYAVYEGDTEVRGVKSVRFVYARSLLESPLRSEENRCVCSHVDDEPEKCLEKGVFDVGPCRDGAPVALSMPHFLHGHPKYQKLQGIRPNREKHESFIDIEPLTGAVLRLSSKVQMSLILKPVRGIRSLKKVPEVIFPMAWVDESYTLDPTSIDLVRGVLNLIWIIGILAKWVLPGICVVLSVVFIFRHWRRKGTRKVPKGPPEENKLKMNLLIQELDLIGGNKDERVPLSADGKYFGI